LLNAHTCARSGAITSSLQTGSTITFPEDGSSSSEGFSTVYIAAVVAAGVALVVIVVVAVRRARERALQYWAAR
jgi:hypothetical protein